MSQICDTDFYAEKASFPKQRLFMVTTVSRVSSAGWNHINGHTFVLLTLKNNKVCLCFSSLDPGAFNAKP